MPLKLPNQKPIKNIYFINQILDLLNFQNMMIKNLNIVTSL